MEKDFLTKLSPVQRQAVTEYNGAALIIAGAGSGKTRVLTCRIAYMLANGISPYQIMALTFTNKAAKEMKQRIAGIIGNDLAKRLWMGTFHSVFAKILRYEAEALGYPKTFTIYDKTDSAKAIKACIKELELDDKVYVPKDVTNRISMAKSNLIFPQAYRNDVQIQAEDKATRRWRIADIYELYQKKNKIAGCMDFDDILILTYNLFATHPEIMQRYAERFKYILVDEYQDTNIVQYQIIKALSKVCGNLAVVGDDSQSIYAFRGAKIENILNFKKDFKDCHEYKLEQNYRSTQTIVNAANSLIDHNKNKLEKECFSTAEEGNKIRIIRANTDREEAYLVTGALLQKMRESMSTPNDMAILYRTNAQSRLFEDELRKKNMPYKVYGATSFYERAEIKDVLAYLRLIVNHNDDEALKRVINTPARGIGDTTMQKVIQVASNKELSIWDTITADSLLQENGLRGAAIKKLKDFTQMIEDESIKTETDDAYTITREIVSTSGLLAALHADTSLEGRGRMENVEELLNSIKQFTENPQQALPSEITSYENEDDVEPIEDVSIGRFLSNVALMSQTDEVKEKEAVALMTVHSAKGLEFKHVYVVGMEQELFPSGTEISETELEEERRLFYVAMTRAKKTLTLSYAQSRMRWGAMTFSRPSIFLKEIDSQYIHSVNMPVNPQSSISSLERTPFSYSQRTVTQRTSPTHYGTTPTSSRSTSSRPTTSRPTGSHSTTTPVRTTVVSHKSTLPPKTPAANFVPESPDVFKVGQRIEHNMFGEGTILSMEGAMPNTKAVIRFANGETKTLLLRFAKLRRI